MIIFYNHRGLRADALLCKSEHINDKMLTIFLKSSHRYMIKDGKFDVSIEKLDYDDVDYTHRVCINGSCVGFCFIN